MAKLRVTYVKSSIGYRQSQKDTVRSLGLRRLHQTVVIEDSQGARGMISTVQHLVRVEEFEGESE